FFLFCALIVLLRTEMEKQFQTIDYSILSMGIVYGLFFPIVVHSANEVNFHGAEFIIDSSDVVYIHTLSASIGVASLIIGWYSPTLSHRAYLRGFFRKCTVKSMTISFYIF